jgi:hypothetical protein
MMLSIVPQHREYRIRYVMSVGPSYVEILAIDSNKLCHSTRKILFSSIVEVFRAKNQVTSISFPGYSELPIKASVTNHPYNRNKE